MASQSPTLISPFLCLHPLLTVSATSTAPTAFCLKKEKKEQTQKDPLALFCVCCRIGMHSFVSLLSSFVSPPPLLQLNEIIRRTIEWQILPSLLPPSPEKVFWQWQSLSAAGMFIWPPTMLEVSDAPCKESYLPFTTPWLWSASRTHGNMRWRFPAENVERKWQIQPLFPNKNYKET